MTTTGERMTAQTDAPNPPDAIRVETTAEGPQNAATVAYLADPSDENLARLKRATIDHGRTILQLVQSIERHETERRASESRGRVARYVRDDGPLAA